MASSCADPVSTDPSDPAPESGFTLVQRNNKRLKRDSDVATIALEPTQTNSEPTKSYSVALSFSINLPSRLQVTKGLRSLNLHDHIVGLHVITDNVCKVVVNSEYAVNKLLCAEVDPPKEWLCATKQKVKISVWKARVATSHMFIINKVSHDLSNQDITDELNNRGNIVSRAIRITSLLSGDPTPFIRVFTQDNEYMKRCLDEGVMICFKKHVCVLPHNGQPTSQNHINARQSVKSTTAPICTTSSAPIAPCVMPARNSSPDTAPARAPTTKTTQSASSSTVTQHTNSVCTSERPTGSVWDLGTAKIKAALTKQTALRNSSAIPPPASSPIAEPTDSSNLVNAVLGLLIDFISKNRNKRTLNIAGLISALQGLNNILNEA